MKKPLTSWKKSLAALGFKVNWDAVLRSKNRKMLKRQQDDLANQHFHIENLEERQMLSVVTDFGFDAASSTLTVTGTPDTDTITISASSGGLVEVGGQETSINAVDVSVIQVLALESDDQVDLSGVSVVDFTSLTNVDIEDGAAADLQVASVSQGDIDLGGTASGSVGAIDETISWSYEASAGESIQIDILQQDGPLTFELIAPSGNIVTPFGSSPSESTDDLIDLPELDPRENFDDPVDLDEFGPLEFVLTESTYGPLDLTEPGTHEFRVTGVTDQAVSFEFQLSAVAAPDVDRIEISETRSGNLETGDARDHWIFNSAGDEAIALTFSRITEPVQYTIVDPEGLPVISGDTFNFGDQRLVELGVAGDYTIEISSRSGLPATYDLGVTLAPAPDVASLNLAEQVTGEIETPVSRDFWTFNADAGQELEVVLTANFAGLNYLIIASDGTVVGEGFSGSRFSQPPNENTIIPADGQYTLSVNWLGGQSGEYSLFVAEALAEDQFRIGNSVDSEIESVDEVDQWRFEATAGQNVAVLLNDASDLLRYRILDPNSNTIFETGAADSSVFQSEFRDQVSDGDFDSGQLELTESGFYIVELEGVEGTLPFYEFSVEEIPAPDQQRVNIDDVTDGEIESLFATDEYVFTATAGQIVKINFPSVQGDVKYRLESPSGDVVASQDQVSGFRDFVGFFGNSSPIVLQDGDYKLIVEHDEPSDLFDSSAELQVSSVSESRFESTSYQVHICEFDAVDMQDLTVGQPVSGDVLLSGEVDQWTFSADAGQNISIDFPSVTDGAGGRSQVRYSIVSPSGDAIAFNQVWDSFSGFNGPYLLQETGDYSVVVTQADDGPADYDLLVEEIAGPNIREISLGDNVTGSIGALAEQDFLDFQGEDGERIYIDFKSIGEDLQLDLIAPDGEFIVEGDFGFSRFPSFLDQGTLVLEQTGTYRIVLTGIGDVFPSSYEFDLLDVTDLIDERGIDFEEVVSGEIESVGAEDRYTFEGVDGQKVFFDFNSVTGGAISWDLVAPSGRIEYDVFSSNSQNPDTERTLRETGQYEVRVQGFRDDTPEYQLQISEVVETIVRPLVAGQLNTSTFASPNAEEHWEFSITEPGVFAIDFLSLEDGRIEYELFGPNGERILDESRTSFLFSLDNGPVVLSEIGDYRLEIKAFDSQPTYQFIADFGSTPLARELTPGQTVTSTLSQLASEQWEFTATAGEIFSFDVLEVDGGQIGYVLFGPNGEVVDSQQWTSSIFALDIVEVALPVDGQYRLLIQSNFEETTYRFDSIFGSQTVVRSLIAGQLNDATLDTPNAEEHWEFSVTEPGLFAIEFLSLENGRVEYELYDPNGVLILDKFRTGEVSDLRNGPEYLTEVGEYRLEIKAFESRPSYQFVADFGSTPQIRELPPEQSVTSTLSSLEADQWEFEATAGETFSFDVLAVDGGDIGYLLLDPDGDVFDRREWLNSASDLDTGQITLPKTGLYRLVVQANSEGAIYQFEARFGATDLIVENLVVPATAFSGQTLTVDWVVTNNGSRATNASQWIDRVFLQSTAPGSRQIELGSVVNASFLAPGESYANSGTFDIGETLFGDYSVIVETDFNEDVREFDNDNNRTVSNAPLTIELSPQADIVVGQVSGPSVAFSGQPTTVNWTVLNQGAASTGTGRWQDTVYLSTDNSLDDDDIALGSFFRPAIDLENGESYSQSQLVSLPVGMKR